MLADTEGPPKLCTCPRCGREPGKLVLPWIYEQHQKIHRLDSYLHMRPLSTFGLEEEQTNAENPEDALKNLREAGRAATVKVMVGLDTLSGLQGAHSILSSTTFKASTLKLVLADHAMEDDAFEIDHDAPENQPYLEHSSRLSAMVEQAGQLRADYGVILGPLIDGFEMEVKNTVTVHEQVLVAAQELQRKKAERYLRDGGGARILGTGKLDFSISTRKFQRLLKSSIKSRRRSTTTTLSI